ncbi:putative nucleolus protein required for cell viability [Aspergillus nomiae NRRL 13137]|uniref:Putative nucleolus protein required for cell viability n=1 Tax=Aspergillus nomiae NRRL (strain ATCC 15546 / NRRL 13137 / CBS 260.88 / M93) TaxID=1509407 RepID=A0A0L1IR98_ASPN3|nr:putative nucleolus protein required for cell viability [Aspergillus nomiae NRRL 13137]KNG81994.1 putative nucleolus protein required for cell viability [Aspergillus nomiae NRRL 13137]
MTQTICGEVGANNGHDQVDITDHDIEELLFEAEGRLRAQDVNSTNRPDTREVSGNQPQHTLLSIPRLCSDRALQPYLLQKDDFTTIDTTRVLKSAQDAHDGLGYKEPKQPKVKKDKPTAGSNWFDLPQTELTPEFKRDLQLLRMRSVLDPKRHYKKENGKAQPPKYSQVGTIIEGPTEFFSGRIAKKDRKRTFVEEVLDQERHNRRFESKYREIQTSKQSGKKSFYKHLQAKRSSKGK